jgi:surface antigen
MRNLIIIAALGLSAATACETPSGQGAAIGGGGGAIIGGLAGGGTGALIGAAAGGLLGYGAGKVVEQRDRERAAIALEQDREYQWRNSEGNTYRVVPGPTHYYSGRQCRDFRMFADIDGRPQEVRGTACRRPDGSWEQISG